MTHTRVQFIHINVIHTLHQRLEQSKHKNSRSQHKQENTFKLQSRVNPSWKNYGLLILKAQYPNL